MPLLLTLLLISDISGLGYEVLLLQTFNKHEAQVMASEFNDCEVFTDVDTKEYSVICKDKSKTYITGVGGTHRKVN